MPMPVPPDPVDDLVRRAREGDRAAFEGIYRLHAGRVYALCLRLAGEAIQAEELVQDTFIRAWRRLRGFRGEASVGAWLHRIAVNEFYQHRRGERRRHARVLPLDEPPEAAGRGHDPAARMDLEAALARLPDGAREVFVLFDIEGYSHAEIAGLVGIAPGTSKAHLHRARRLLRGMLQR